MLFTDQKFIDISVGKIDLESTAGVTFSLFAQNEFEKLRKQDDFPAADLTVCISRINSSHNVDRKFSHSSVVISAAELSSPLQPFSLELAYATVCRDPGRLLDIAEATDGENLIVCLTRKEKGFLKLRKTQRGKYYLERIFLSSASPFCVNTPVMLVLPIPAN
jgi:hypothetical protein